MAMALIAWLRAPAPITWTSTLPICRTTPASAPATELGLDREDTFRTSMAVPSCGGRSSASLSARYAGFLPKTLRRRTVCPNLCQAYLRSVLRQPLCVNLKTQITQGSHWPLPNSNPKGKGSVAHHHGPLFTHAPGAPTPPDGSARAGSRLGVGHLGLDLGHLVARADSRLPHH